MGSALQAGPAVAASGGNNKSVSATDVKAAGVGDLRNDPEPSRSIRVSPTFSMFPPRAATTGLIALPVVAAGGGNSKGVSDTDGKARLWIASTLVCHGRPPPLH